jgi:hypothetical protein
MAMIWGLPWRIFVSVMGFVVVVLSVTGVMIWLRKRRARSRDRVPQFPYLDTERAQSR